MCLLDNLGLSETDLFTKDSFLEEKGIFPDEDGFLMGVLDALDDGSLDDKEGEEPLLDIILLGGTDFPDIGASFEEVDDLLGVWFDLEGDGAREEEDDA